MISTSEIFGACITKQLLLSLETVTSGNVLYTDSDSSSNWVNLFNFLIAT